MFVTSIYPYIQYKYITSNSEAHLELTKLKEDIEVKKVGLDTETTGLDPHTSRIRLVQLWPKGWEYGLILDCFSCNNVFPLLHELISVRKDIIWIGHNLKFEFKMLWSNGVELYGSKVYDTYLASTILDCGLGEPQKLGDVFDRYIGEYLDKGEQVSDWGKDKLDRSQLDYAITDSWSVIKVEPVLTQELVNEDLVDTFKLETKVLPALAAMEWQGVKVDQQKLAELKPFYEDRLAIAEKQVLSYVKDRYELLDLFGNVLDTGFSVTSSSQVLKLLHELGIPNPMKEEKGFEHFDLIPSTGKNMTALLDWTEYPILEALDNHRKASKLLSSYIYSLPDLINPVTGKLHTNFRQLVSTGRAASSSPNLNQLPRPQKGVPSVRECFIPEEGYDLVIFDYCVAKGTKVSTITGLIPIEKVKVGNIVYQDNGDLGEVTRVIERGVLSTQLLKTKLGYQLKATENHRLRVLENNEYVWKYVKDIKKGDRVALASNRGFDLIDQYYRLPELAFCSANSNTNIKVPSYATERFAEFLGYLAGDGSFKQSGIDWVVCDKDPEVADYLKDSAKLLFNYSCKEKKYRGVYQSWLHSVNLSKWLKSLKSTKEEVPDFIYQSPKSVVTAYLRGLFESDGSVCDRITVCTTSKVLMSQVHDLLLSLGILSALRLMKKGKLAKKQAYLIEIKSAFASKFRDLIGFISDRKKEKLNKLCNTSGYSSYYGSIFLTSDFIKNTNPKGQDYALLRNSIVLNRPISFNTAKKLYEHNPALAIELGVDRTVVNQVYYDEIVSNEYYGEEECFDLTVPHRNTYITNGFVNHNCQIELRVISDVCRAASDDPTKSFPMLQEFLDGKDPYASTGAIINHISYDQMLQWKKEGDPRYKEIRQKAKAVKLGYNFSMGAPKFKLYAKQQYKQDFTLEEAFANRKAFFDSYCDLVEYHKLFNDKSIREVTTFDTYRRKRKFRDYPGVPALCNHPIQGGAGNIQKTAIYRLFDLWYSQGYSPLGSHGKQLLLTVHDELNAQALKSLSEEASKEMHDCMVEAGQAQLKYCPVEAEGKIAKTLADKD